MTTLRALGLSLLLSLGMVGKLAAVPAFAPPVVVIYPLTLAGVNGHVETGSDVAIMLGTRVAQDGSVTVRPYTPGTTRAAYLDAALKEKADYYVTGYLQQIGSDVSMIIQVVSTHSGSVVYSSTTTIKTYGDAAAQGEPLRAAILSHAGRGLAALDAPQPGSLPTSEPSASQGVNLTRALRRRSKAAASPSPSPSSDAELVPVSQIAANSSGASPKPTPTPTPSPTPIAITAYVATTHRGSIAANAVTTILVIDTDGTESGPLRTQTSDSIVAALRAIGFPAARLPATAAQVTPNAASICRANRGTERFYEPTLVLGHDSQGMALATISVVSIDCNGTVAARRQATSIGTATGREALAIDRAATVVATQLNGV